VTRVEPSSTNGTRSENFVAGPSPTLVGFLVVVLMAASLAISARPAGADQPGDLQSQANQLGQQIADGANKIHQLDAQFGDASSKANQLQSQIASLQGDVASAQGKVTERKNAIRKAAVTAYMTDGTSSSTLSAVLDGNPNQFAIRRAYLDFTTGDLRGQIDSLHLAEESLRAQQEQLRRDQEAVQSTLAQVARDRQAAAAQIGQEQSALAQVKGEQAQLVAEAEQAQLVAEANAKRTRAAAASPAQRVGTRAEGQPTPSGLGTVGRGSGGGRGGGGGGDAFAGLRQCESGGNYAENTGNGFYGAYQFSLSTWQGLGYSGLPSDAPPAVQDQAARQLQAADGWGAWPTCAAILGLL
jgi:resuscitation-promoting factor RpfB